MASVSIPVTVLNPQQPPALVQTFADPRQAFTALSSGAIDLALIDEAAMVRLLDGGQRHALKDILWRKHKYWSVTCMLWGAKQHPTFNMVVEAYDMLMPIGRGHDTHKRFHAELRPHQDRWAAINTVLRKKGPKTIFIMPAYSRQLYGSNQIDLNTNEWLMMDGPGTIVPKVVRATDDIINLAAPLTTPPPRYFPIFAADRLAHAEPADRIRVPSGHGYDIVKRLTGIRCPKRARRVIRTQKGLKISL